MNSLEYKEIKEQFLDQYIKSMNTRYMVWEVSMDFDEAFANFNKIVQLEKDRDHNRNESMIRLQLVNNILTDCLGWTLEEISTERFHNGEYSDYELGKPYPRLLVETKKEGIYFDLPISYNQKKYKIDSIMRSSPELKRAISQAMDYCKDRGIELGVISNGNQFVLFVGTRTDGISPNEGEAIVYPSLDFISEHFIDFWNNLSVDGLKTGYAIRILKGEKLTVPPEKLSTKLHDYPGVKDRNPMAVSLQFLGELFLEDLARLPEYEDSFIKETYCESGAYSQQTMVSREILSNRYSDSLPFKDRDSIQPATTKKGVSPDLTQNLFQAGISRRPIILVGDVGVGKSMFIKHLIKVDAKDILDQAIVLYLDFGSKPTLNEDLSQFILQEIENQLIQQYRIDIYDDSFIRGVYHSDLSRFAHGIYKNLPVSEFKNKEIEFLGKKIDDFEHHILNCFNHITKPRRKQIVLFLDNVDQRPDSFQEQVFLKAQSFAETWPVTVFLSLRPDTFIHSKSNGTIAAYQPRIFTISPPRIDKVLTKRLSWGLSLMKTKGRLPGFPDTMILDSFRLEQYVEMLLKTFSEFDETASFIDNMSNGNIRKALDYVSTFIGSPHVDSEKIFRIIDSNEEYTLRLFEFLHAVMYNDNEYYNSQDSPIINIFDITSNDRKEHYLLMLLILIIDKFGKSGGNDGYISISIVEENLHSLGFLDSQIQQAINRAITKKLIECSKQNVNNFRVLPSGIYSVTMLPIMFAYIDAIIIDTPICDEETKSLIHISKTIQERLERSLIFIEYIKNSADPKMEEFIDYKEMAGRLRREINNIQEKLKPGIFR